MITKLKKKTIYIDVVKRGGIYRELMLEQVKKLCQRTETVLKRATMKDVCACVAFLPLLLLSPQVSIFRYSHHRIIPQQNIYVCIHVSAYVYVHGFKENNLRKTWMEFPKYPCDVSHCRVPFNGGLEKTMHHH